MIRIFITAILYLISFFTQAQTDSIYEDESYSCNTYSSSNLVSQGNQAAKFELIDKDLTFEIK